MRAAVLRVRAEDADATLDHLLPVAPLGVYERDAGPYVELTLPGTEVAGAETRELPDDEAQRLALLMEPPVVADRFVIVPPGAPPVDPSLEPIVVDRGGTAFGSGLHPTTRRCLGLLLTLEPSGSFADLGCGTGVLAIGAAKLGWSPVVAVDYDARSVAAAARNGELNGVTLDARVVDLLAEPPPEAQTVVANMPLHVQTAVREAMGETPRALVLSGVSPRDGDALVKAWGQRGLVERTRVVESDWAMILLTKPEVELRPLPEPRLRVRAPSADIPLAGVPAGPAPATLAGQLATELPDGGLALSCARELQTGARVALILAPGMFRLDVRHLEDTLKVSLRNVSGQPIRQLADVGPPRTIVSHGDVASLGPVTNSRMILRIGAGSGTHEAEIVLSALSGQGGHGGRVTAQAVIRPVQESSGAVPNLSA